MSASDDLSRKKRRALRVPADDVPRAPSQPEMIIPPEAAPTYVDEDEFDTKTSLRDEPTRNATIVVSDDEVEPIDARRNNPTEFDVDVVSEEPAATLRSIPVMNEAALPAASMAAAMNVTQRGIPVVTDRNIPTVDDPNQGGAATLPPKTARSVPAVSEPVVVRPPRPSVPPPSAHLVPTLAPAPSTSMSGATATADAMPASSALFAAPQQAGPATSAVPSTHVAAASPIANAAPSVLAAGGAASPPPVATGSMATPPAPPPAGPTKPPPAPSVASPPPPPARPAKESRAHWFEEVFDEDYLRTLPFMTPQTTLDEAQFVADALGLRPGAAVLDVGCGYGRHAMELAARGLKVVGIDLSLPLLLRGADEAQRRGLHVNFVQGDMRTLDFKDQFDGAYCLFSTFGYFDDENNKRTLANLAQCLKVGGRLVLDVLNRDYVVRDLPTRVMWDGDGCVVMEEVDFNYYASRIVSHRTVLFHDGRQAEQRISIRAYSLHELGKILHGAGLHVVDVSGSVETRGRFFGPQSRQVIVVAERRQAS